MPCPAASSVPAQPDAQDAERERYLSALQDLFYKTKGLLIDVPGAVERFKQAEPRRALLVLNALIERGLIYPTTCYRTQIRGSIDGIYNELSRSDRWQGRPELPAGVNALWDELAGY